MMDVKEFSLLREQWILVMKKEGDVEEVSLLDAFRNAHLFKGLVGELPTQDIALLRLMLSVLHAIFARYDLEGNYRPLVNVSDAYSRWQELWNKRNFPMEIIEKYLNNFNDKFYLFPQEKSFFQVADIGNSTEYGSAKLNGSLSESGNKIRLFSTKTGHQKSQLSYAEAARWIFHVNGFDDTSSKPKGKDLPSPGVGWLGKLGLIYALGDNLFETLLLNLVLISDGNTLWDPEEPAWEGDVSGEERKEIQLPRNLSSLYSLQSRRIKLKAEGDLVVGYYLLGGDFFLRENALTEQMTVWRFNKVKGKPAEFIPKRHDPERQLWRDFSILLSQSDSGDKAPGVVRWISNLKRNNILESPQFSFCTPGVKYGDKDFFVEEIFSDSLSFSSELFSLKYEHWGIRILNEIEITERLVTRIGILASDIAKASGDSSGNFTRQGAKEQCYYRLDLPFREWLEKINPEKDDLDEVCDEWFLIAQGIVRNLGREIVEKSGTKAIVGREVEEKIKSKKVKIYYAAPKSYNTFLYFTNLREVKKEEKSNG